MIEIPFFVSVLIDALTENGYEAFAVGGCVRDSLLGIEPKDYDVTTNAKPDEIKKVLHNYKIIETGVRFGTLTVISEGNPVEITTYRIDGDYNDNRRPESVSYTSDLAEDLRRRDFTINAMAFNKNVGIVDLFNGQNDLKEGIIRTIDSPYDRFNEDGLRIMRALRFAARYNFTVEENTAEAIHSLRFLLKNIAAERIASEFNQLLCGRCEEILREYSDVISVFIPEIQKCVGFEQHSKYHNRNVYEHIIATVTAIEPIKHLRLTMLFHDIGKPQYFKKDENGTGHFKGHASGSCEIAERVLRELKYDSETINKVLILVKNHDIVIENRENLLKRLLNRLGAELLLDLISVHIADDLGKAVEYQFRIEEYKAAAETVKKIIEERQCFSLKDLDINGNDLIKLNFKGKAIGYILNNLLEKVIDGSLENKKENLIAEAIKLEVGC